MFKSDTGIFYLQTFWKLNVCLTIQFAAFWQYLSFELMEDKPGITKI
jgi:hypothetical protein